MKLRKALGFSRIFIYRGKRYYAFLYPKEKFWTEKEFPIVVNDHPMPNGCFNFSSEIDVKPVIRT